MIANLKNGTMLKELPKWTPIAYVNQSSPMLKRKKRKRRQYAAALAFSGNTCTMVANWHTLKH